MTVAAHAPLQLDASLAEHNSFGVRARCAALTELRAIDEITQVLKTARQFDAPPLLLGDGSNVLLVEDYSGLVVINQLHGRRLLADDGDQVLVEVAAGENWDALVSWTLQQGWNGLENLALIPGRVGAAPIQNIGAYGVEFESVCAAVQIFDRQLGETRWLTAEQCQFGYRDSVFKHAGAEWWVTAVRLRLRRHAAPSVDYSGLREELQRLQLDANSAQAVATAVRSLRRRKLPDPKQIGNAGSFFKNPLVSAEQAAALAAQLPGLPRYPQADGQIKLSAAYLIDQAGWKGYRDGDAGVHTAHALVLVNYGAASGLQLFQLANKIADDVAARWSVRLEIEPRVINAQTFEARRE